MWFTVRCEDTCFIRNAQCVRAAASIKVLLIVCCLSQELIDIKMVQCQRVVNGIVIFFIADISHIRVGQAKQFLSSKYALALFLGLNVTENVTKKEKILDSLSVILTVLKNNYYI